MVAVIGRRRVGKTFLIKTVYKEQILFEITGLQNAPLKEQLENFTFSLQRYAKAKLPIETPKAWLQAFMLLIEYLEQFSLEEKKVVFLDELSWLATHKSGFLRALGFFWNSWAVNQNIVVVICGSAASWMIRKVVNHRGGLHNRITRHLFLQPFTLSETKAFLESRNVFFNPYQIVQLYMALGGVPHYLKEIDGNKSAVQNIDHICFSNHGLLKNEFNRLYPALFEHSEQHVKIVKTLAKSNQGLNRKQLIQNSKLPENGGTSRLLNELEQSGFITSYFAFGKKKKDKIYRLTDAYSLFYLRFIKLNKSDGQGTWQHLSQTASSKIWQGYAYENICFTHLTQIKKALGISGIYSLSSSFYKKGTSTEEGTQIDLLIDRKDDVINLLEVKFYNKPFTLTKEYAQKLQKKQAIFEETTQTRKQIFITLITTFGLKSNTHSLGLIHPSLMLEDLFVD